ncbi:hypothetical protein CO666_09050 [Rhizobium chutanense]|uniref:Uncharacterized protein n=1 Tax=Rhizobium chutanense TaxID=2035448 RepID=A0A2A6JEZ6_9HYPH|nr:hypothetical protein CO666_09050 [Rhizobium chutanense]
MIFNGRFSSADHIQWSDGHRTDVKVNCGDVLELKIRALTAASRGQVSYVDMEKHHGFDTATSDDADITLQLDIGPKDADWTETFSIRVATPRNMSKSNSRMKTMRIHSFSFETLKTYLVTAVASCERETWDECLDALRTRFLWEWDTPNKQKSKR